MDGSVNRNLGFVKMGTMTLVGYTVRNISAVHSLPMNQGGLNYSVLRIDIELERDLSPYIVQYYLPSALLVVLSWGAFWIPNNVYPARVALILTNSLSSCVIIKGKNIIMN